MAVICGNHNPTNRMAYGRSDSGPIRTCSGDFRRQPAANSTQPNLPSGWGKTVFDLQDLFQWDRFITPTIIKTFYWLAIGLIVLFGIYGILRRMPVI